MSLPNWTERPNTVAFLLNPAFCGEVLKRGIIEYQKINKSGIPFQLIFLILPIALNQSIRDILPKSSRKGFISWLEENQILKKDLPQSIRAMVPYTKESLMFLTYISHFPIKRSQDKVHLLFKRRNESVLF